MKKETLLKKIAKLGLTVQDDGHRCYIHHNGQIASWFWQECWEEDKKGQYYGTNWHTKGENQESDPYTDYFPGTHWDNASQMLSRLVPPQPKFAIGSIVRGKQNKRAQRRGYAGRQGLVVGNGGTFANVDWMGFAKSPYNSYPERDLELVSAA